MAEQPAKRFRGEPEHVDLYIISPDKSKILVELKRSTQMEHIMRWFCAVENIPRDFVRFMYKDEPLEPVSTADTLGMSKNDSVNVEFLYSLPEGLTQLIKALPPDAVQKLEDFAKGDDKIREKTETFEEPIPGPVYVRCAHQHVTVNTLSSSVCARNSNPDTPFKESMIYEFWFDRSTLRCEKKEKPMCYSTVPIVDEEKRVQWNLLKQDESAVYLAPQYHFEIDQAEAIDTITKMMLPDDEYGHVYPYEYYGCLVQAPMWYAASTVINNICYTFHVKHKHFNFLVCGGSQRIADHKVTILKCLDNREYDVVTASFKTSTDEPHIGGFFYQEPGVWVSVGIFEPDLTDEDMQGLERLRYTRLVWGSEPLPDQLDYSSPCQSVIFAALLHWLKFGYLKVFMGPRYSMWRVEFWQALGKPFHVKIFQPVANMKTLIRAIRRWVYRGQGDAALPKKIIFTKNRELRAARTHSVEEKRPPAVEECRPFAAFVDLCLK